MVALGHFALPIRRYSFAVKLNALALQSVNSSLQKRPVYHALPAPAVSKYSIPEIFRFTPAVSKPEYFSYSS